MLRFNILFICLFWQRSGRIAEEIEMLQCKLKKIEEGIAFGGAKTKLARSQGKKIQITVAQERSRRIFIYSLSSFMFSLYISLHLSHFHQLIMQNTGELGLGLFAAK